MPFLVADLESGAPGAESQDPGESALPECWEGTLALLLVPLPVDPSYSGSPLSPCSALHTVRLFLSLAGSVPWVFHPRHSFSWESKKGPSEDGLSKGISAN